MFKVRFNLSRGEYYQQWQVSSRHDNSVSYFDPSDTTLIMTDATLRNRPATAQKIYDGAKKDVCAFIECAELEVRYKPVEAYESQFGMRAYFNPQKHPAWLVAGHEADGMLFSVAYTMDNEVYVENEN